MPDQLFAGQPAHALNKGAFYLAHVDGFSDDPHVQHIGAAPCARQSACRSPPAHGRTVGKVEEVWPHGLAIPVQAGRGIKPSDHSCTRCISMAHQVSKRHNLTVDMHGIAGRVPVWYRCCCSLAAHFRIAACAAGVQHLGGLAIEVSTGKRMQPLPRCWQPWWCPGPSPARSQKPRPTHAPRLARPWCSGPGPFPLPWFTRMEPSVQICTSAPA